MKPVRSSAHSPEEPAFMKQWGLHGYPGRSIAETTLAERQVLSVIYESGVENGIANLARRGVAGMMIRYSRGVNLADGEPLALVIQGTTEFLPGSSTSPVGENGVGLG